MNAPAPQKELFRYGFIATAKPQPEVSILKQTKPICAAYISVDPSNLEILFLDYLLFFRYDPEVIAKDLLKISAKAVWIDEINYKWLYQDWQREQMIAENKSWAIDQQKIELPNLEIAYREEDRLIRQWKALQKPIQENQLSFAKDISINDRQAVKTPGDQAAPDAVAGAIEIISLRKDYIKQLSMINPKIPPRWLGVIPRWNEERRQKE